MTHRIGIDIGGTFTDFALFDVEDRTLAIHKQLTTPDDPSRAVLEGISVLLEREQVSIETLAEIVHGTTLVTNAVIERRGARTGMVTTAGFKDILDMRQEKRYDVFDLRLQFPQTLVPRPYRVEVNERCHYDGSVEIPLDVAEAEQAIAALVNDHDIEALAICLLHSYANPAHERAIEQRVRDQFPQLYVCTSADVFPGRREYERFVTACINAYTQPMFDRYLERIESGVAALGFGGRLLVMSSSGGTLSPQMARRHPVRVVESGPAAGVQMSMVHGQALNLPDLLSFDMGGTTAKGALVRGGATMKVYEQEVARQHEFKRGSGLPVKSPVVDMIEIGAGGGSVAEVDLRGTIRVGPRSAGAEPGPACYGRGGRDATLTDANTVLGYLDPDFFLGGEMLLDLAAAQAAVQQHIATPLALPLQRAALGIHEIISEDVARAFRIHASERGFDYRRSTMIAFGGSGPIHAMGVARKLRIPRVVYPVAAGVMSALGLLSSPLSFEMVVTRQRFVDEIAADEFEGVFATLTEAAMAPLLDAGLSADALHIARRLDMRYHGQVHEIEVVLPDAASNGESTLMELPRLFREQYERLYSFAYLDAPLVVTTWKVEVRGPLPDFAGGSGQPFEAGSRDSRQARKGERHAYFAQSAGYVSTPVYDRYALAPGAVIAGPALVEEHESTVVIDAGSRVQVDDRLNLVAELDSAPEDDVEHTP